MKKSLVLATAALALAAFAPVASVNAVSSTGLEGATTEDPLKLNAQQIQEAKERLEKANPGHKAVVNEDGTYYLYAIPTPAPVNPEGPVEGNESSTTESSTTESSTTESSTTESSTTESSKTEGSVVESKGAAVSEEKSELTELNSAPIHTKDQKVVAVVKVLDQAGNPVEGASVEFAPGIVVKTDAQGFATLENVDSKTTFVAHVVEAPEGYAYNDATVKLTFKDGVAYGELKASDLSKPEMKKEEAKKEMKKEEAKPAKKEEGKKLPETGETSTFVVAGAGFVAAIAGAALVVSNRKKA